MSGTLSSTTASALAPLLQTLTGVASLGSTGYNLFNQYQNQQYQNTLRSDAQNPAKVTALAQQYTQPLTAGLTAAVNNQTQAQLAQAGLSESPQIAQTVEAQAIAPYIQQNQQQGYQDAIQALGLGGGAIPPALAQQNNLTALAKAFSMFGQPGGSQMNPALFAQLMQQGAVQPAQLDQSTYTPDYAATLMPPPAPTGGDDSTDYSGASF
jgi:hypothetical protein